MATKVKVECTETNLPLFRKGCMDRPGTELRSKCTSHSVNTFCGKLPSPHDECSCHNTSEKKRMILREMKKIVDELEQMPQCEEWDTRDTRNDTKGPYRFGVYKQQGKPWDPHRVKSIDLVGGELYRGCECLRKNGLQDSCRRIQCRGRPWCFDEPFPTCPPFSSIPRIVCDPDPYKECPRRPWEDHPLYSPPCAPFDKPNYDTVATCQIQCPNTGETQEFSVSPTTTAELPAEFQNTPGPFFRLERMPKK